MVTLEDKADEFIKEESPTAEATKHLLNIKPSIKGISDIELKTDLTVMDVSTHTIMSVLNTSIEQTEKEFSSKCILGDLINIKERKSLSKDRKSRGEIVEIARHPDMNVTSNEQTDGAIKRFFTPRKK